MIMSKLFSTNLIKTTLTVVVASGVLFFCQSTDSKKTLVEASPATEKSVAKKPDSTSVNNEPVPEATVQERKLIVYYFHTKFRCHSCNMIENLTKQAVNSGFASQLKNGRVELKIVNIEEPGNEHFADDYKLYTKSVIISDVKNGKEDSWKNLDKVWTLLGSDDKFMEYIKTEVKALL